MSAQNTHPAAIPIVLNTARSEMSETRAREHLYNAPAERPLFAATTDRDKFHWDKEQASSVNNGVPDIAVDSRHDLRLHESRSVAARIDSEASHDAKRNRLASEFRVNETGTNGFKAD